MLQQSTILLLTTVGFYGLPFVSTEWVDDDPYASCALPPDPELNPFINKGGFLLLILASILSLVSMAHVCEEYFVPALEIFCKRWNVPESVAGSLVMAGGDFEFIYLFVYIIIIIIIID